MRDPYEILGVARGASLDEIKAAYRRACKQRHPDIGGSHEAMVELNTAYAFVLNELKQGYQQQREEAPRQDQRRHAPTSATRAQLGADLPRHRRRTRGNAARRRGARGRAAQDARAGMADGDRTAWAKLTWEDLARFFRGVARSGVKGLALLFAALVGIGSVLVEANFISALILLGSGLGFAFSLALKSDKGGIMSAALLLFGIMTIWLPPVRGALFLYPLATISVLILLALIFKFAQAGGTVGLMTGGVARALCHRRDRRRHGAASAEGRGASAAADLRACLQPDQRDAGRALRTETADTSLAAGNRAVAIAATDPRADSARAAHAARLAGRDPEIRRRRPVSSESANRARDLVARHPGQSGACVERRRHSANASMRSNFRRRPARGRGRKSTVGRGGIDGCFAPAALTRS